MNRHTLPIVTTLLAALPPAAPPVAAQHPDVGGSVAEAGVVEGTDFRVYDARGRSRSFADVLAAMERVDAVLVGESHDDAVGHGVETELLVRAAQRYGALSGEDGRPVVLSLEMFERDVQYILDEYLAGWITEGQFLASSRPWDRYATDYRPMVEFARAHSIPVVAANAPRRYVNRVTRLGAASLEELPETAKRFLPPLPYPGPSDTYRAQWDALMADMMRSMAEGAAEAAGDAGDVPAPDEAEEAAPAHGAPEAPRHDMGNALASQALWDAAMGHAVARSLDEHPGALVLHYAGSFHVEARTGIPERVPEYRPGARMLTVVLKPADDVLAWDEESHEDLGDFVILTRRPDEPAAPDPER